MKTRTLVVVIAFAVLLIAGVRSTASTGQAVVSLRVNEPLEAVVAELEAFIPAYMEQEGVPGVAVALVRDGDVVWTGNNQMVVRYQMVASIVGETLPCLIQRHSPPSISDLERIKFGLYLLQSVTSALVAPTVVGFVEVRQ